MVRLSLSLARPTDFEWSSVASNSFCYPAWNGNFHYRCDRSQVYHKRNHSYSSGCYQFYRRSIRAQHDYSNSRYSLRLEQHLSVFQVVGADYISYSDRPFDCYRFTHFAENFWAGGAGISLCDQPLAVSLLQCFDCHFRWVTSLICERKIAPTYLPR